MRGISHSSVIKLLSFIESPDFYFLILERQCNFSDSSIIGCISFYLVMDGGELFHQIVKLTYFSENLSRHVILQVAHGIRYLHEERGVVHR
jgi:serine/threonine protein kinase